MTTSGCRVRPSATPGLASTDPIEPYRLLAAAVIRQAVEDVVSERVPGHTRAAARRFLSASGMLMHWCAVAGLDAELVMQLAREACEQEPRGARESRSSPSQLVEAA